MRRSSFAPYRPPSLLPRLRFRRALALAIASRVKPSASVPFPELGPTDTEIGQDFPKLIRAQPAAVLQMDGKRSAPTDARDDHAVDFASGREVLEQGQRLRTIEGR